MNKIKKILRNNCALLKICINCQYFNRIYFKTGRRYEKTFYGVCFRYDKKMYLENSCDCFENKNK